jgi:signal transduction histidine kinase
MKPDQQKNKRKSKAKSSSKVERMTGREVSTFDSAPKDVVRTSYGTGAPAEDEIVASAFVHQMRNHLGLARAIAKELMEAVKKDDTKLSDYEILAQRLEASLALVESFLYSRKRLPRRELSLVSIPQVLTQAIETVIVPASIQIELNLQTDLPLVWARPNELAVAISNILQNSIQALSEGGTITLTAGAMQKDVKKFVRITVADNGPGIPPEILKDLFQQKISKKPGGLGIGLWLTKIIIETFGGEIYVQSTSNQGTEVQILLPVLEEAK